MLFVCFSAREQRVILGWEPGATGQHAVGKRGWY